MDRVTPTVLLVGLGIGLGAPAGAQQATRFRISAGGGALSGWEEFTITAMAPGGFQVSGQGEINRGGQLIAMVHTAALAANRGPGHYRLSATIGGVTQRIEAWREGDTVRMRASAGDQEHTGNAAADARTLLLDNLVVSHFQILLDRYLAEPADARDGDWTFIVPQALTAVRGRITPGADGSGTLDGQPVSVRRLTLEVGGQLVELEATADGRLLRAAVPVQRVELVRDGYGTAAVPPSAPPPCEEREIEIASGEFHLPGTLCVPPRGDAVPIVVLVHGSGPNDRDETIGPNKPFRDIAHGLAAAGIATLRYDKRTFAHRGRLAAATLTVEEEVIADAVAAVQLARTQRGLDPARTYLLGHSLGGTLGPLIAERLGDELRGLILLAPSARPLDSVIVEQTAFRMRTANQPDSVIAAQAAELERGFTRVRSGEAPDSEMVFGASARYWRDLFARRPLEVLRQLDRPVLVLQGGKDYQVTRADYERVEAALAGKPPARARLLWFPELNHLFMRVDGASTGAEYGKAGTVDASVVESIVAWVRQTSAP